MKLWRIVLDASGEVWTVVVAAADGFAAVALAQGAMPDGRGADAELEELEALYEPCALARPAVVRAWSVRRVKARTPGADRRRRGPQTRLDQRRVGSGSRAGAPA